MKLVWTSEAMNDRFAIFDFVAGDDPGAALALDDFFIEKAGTLLEYPETGRVGRVAGTREYVVHRSYVLIYEVTDGVVYIPGILNSARKWPPDG